MASQGQHVLATRLTADSDDDDYHGAAWIYPSPIGSDISPDADGVYPNPLRFLVDISHMLSRTLGKQMSMTETYRVTGIKVGVKNVDNIDDNDRGIVLGGYLEWYTPTRHKIDAIQASRRIERASEASQIDSDALYIRTQDRYTGFRYNWNADGQVAHPTHAGAVLGWNSNTGDDEWSMTKMFALYGQSLGPAPGCARGRQLWTSKVGHVSLMRWALAFNNAMHEDSTVGSTSLIENPGVNDFEFQAESGRHIDVMGGLIMGEVQFSNTLPNGDVSPDDYDLQVEITVEGWSSW